MRIGLMVGSDKERPRDERLAGLLVDGAAAEAAGFSSFWFPQVPGYLDAMTALALLGQSTATIELGTAVVPVQTRHPMILAQQALTTTAACGGRFALGLGVSHDWIIDGQLVFRTCGPHTSCVTVSMSSPRPSADLARSTSTTTLAVCTARWMSPIGRLHRSCSPPWDPRCCGSPASGPTAPSCGSPTSVRSASTSPQRSARRLRPRAGPHLGSLRGCRWRCVRRPTYRPLGPMPARFSGMRTSPPTTFGFSSTGTPEMSVTRWLRETKPPFWPGCAGTAMPASQIWPFGWSRSEPTSLRGCPPDGGPRSSWHHSARRGDAAEGSASSAAKPPMNSSGTPPTVQKNRSTPGTPASNNVTSLVSPNPTVRFMQCHP